MSWKAVKTVMSSTTGEKYYIKHESGTKNYSCTCKSWVFSNQSPKTCKHIEELLQQKGKDFRWVVKNGKGQLITNQLFDSSAKAGGYADYYRWSGAYVEKVKV